MLTSLADTFEINRERAIDYLNTRDNVYVFDGFAGVRLHFDMESVMRLIFFRLVGSQVPNQSSGYLCSCLSRAIHGMFLASAQIAYV